MEGAPLVHTVRPMERILTLRDWEVQSMKRHQYGLLPIIAAGREWYCKCGHRVETGHNHTCNRIRGPATFHRHQCVVRALVDIGTFDCGLQCVETPRVYADVKDHSDDDYIVPDIVFTGFDFNLAIDVSGVYGESSSNLPKELRYDMPDSELRGKAVINREKSKRRHYSDLPRNGECDFLPFVFESHGGLGNDAAEVISRLATYASERNGCTVPEMNGYFKRIIAVAIQRGNAGLDQIARQKQAGSFGAAVARGFAVAARD